MEPGPQLSRFGSGASLPRNGNDAAVVFVFEELVSVFGVEKEHDSIVDLFPIIDKWLERHLSQESCH
jgi:hypothetical protein